MSGAAEAGWYVFALLPAGAPAPGASPPDAPGLTLIQAEAAPLTALAMLIDCAAYAAGNPAAEVNDPAWVEARARTHHAVVSWATAAGPCLPLGFGTVFSTRAALLAWLAEHAPGLTRALDQVAGRQEWVLTLTEDADRHAAYVARTDSACVALAAAAASAGPGTEFLLSRRMARAVRDARAAHALDEAAGVSAALAHIAAHVRQEAPRQGAVAAWSLLVASGTAPERSLAALAASLDGSGLSLALAGPYPPYGFARAAWEEARHAA